MKTRTTTIAMCMAMLAGIAMINSCGTSKSAGGFQDANDVEKYAQEKPEYRQYGKGEHFKEMTARTAAEAQARGAYARAIATKVQSALEESGLGDVQFSGDSNTGNAETDQASSLSDRLIAVAKGTINNTTTVKSLKKQLPNKQWEYWVCLESPDPIGKMAVATAKKVKERIPEEVKKKNEARLKEFDSKVDKFMDE